MVDYEDAVGETARLTEQLRELDEQEQAELSRKLALLESKLPEHPEMSITYFMPDTRKAGGAYVTLSGNIQSIEFTSQYNSTLQHVFKAR